MKSIVELILLFLIGLSVVGTLKFSEYRREISFSNARFIRANEFGSLNNSWHGFVYALCTYAEGESRDINCKIVMEKPTSERGAKSKFCDISYSNEEMLKQHTSHVNSFHLDLALLHYIDDNRLALQILLEETYLSRSRLISFIDMDSCKAVDRYFIAKNHKERIEVIFDTNAVIVTLCESKNCRNLYVDFDGKDKTQPKKLILKEQYEKFLISRRASTHSNDFLGYCKKIVNISSNSNVTEYICDQHDNEYNLKFNTTFEDAKDSSLVNVYNLPDGGLVAITTDCRHYEYFDSECDSFDIHKISINGIYDGYVTVTEMQPYEGMTFLSNDREFCMFAMYAPSIPNYFTKTTKQLDIATLRGKCIKSDLFLEFD